MKTAATDSFQSPERPLLLCLLCCHPEVLTHVALPASFRPPGGLVTHTESNVIMLWIGRGAGKVKQRMKETRGGEGRGRGIAWKALRPPPPGAAGNQVPLSGLFLCPLPRRKAADVERHAAHAVPPQSSSCSPRSSSPPAPPSPPAAA